MFRRRIRPLSIPPAAFLVFCCAVLFLLWLPGLRYPVVSDTAHYAQLGWNMIHGEGYTIGGVPYAAHLPLHALLSVPFTMLLGINLGMHVLTLVGGFATLILLFFLLDRAVSRNLAMLATAFLLLHPGFLLMTMLGSADLTFTAFLLASLLFYTYAADDRRWYWACGVALGLLCLTRYNGLPFFPLLFLWTIAFRPRDRWSPWFWWAMIVGAVIASMWFLRNMLVFGDPLHTVYTAELAQESDGPILQIWSNILYYGNPLHNIFLLLPFAIIGVVSHARRQTFLLAAMLCAWLLTAVWWVQAMRFAFPGYPLLLGFAALGIMDTARRARLPAAIAIIVIAGAAVIHAGFVCAYTYGKCNAFIDRYTDVLPKNLGLTPEGFEAWAQARDWINTNAPQGATIAAPGANFELRPSEKVFRSDLRVVEPGAACPASTITQHPAPDDIIFFTTEDAPLTSVVLRACP